MTVPDVPNWMRCVQLVGEDPDGNPVLVALDENGNIIAVLKGMYDTTLKTLKTDADGRLIALLTDPEDIWGVFKAMGFAGLAACLSPAKRYDFRGDVLFLDTFEDGFTRWDPSPGSANSEIYLSAAEAHHGAYSVAISAAAEIAGGGSIGFELPYPYTSKLGVEFYAYLPSDFDYFSLQVYKYDGTNVHYGGIRYDQGGTKLQYRDAAGVWQDLRTGVTLHGLTKVFTAFKLVADFDNDLYIRSLVNNYYDDMDAIALRSAADASTPRFRIVLDLTGDAANAAIAYVDSVIVTQNEPVNP